MTQAVEPIVLPPIEAFLIQPKFAASDLWVWPLYLIVTFFWIRGLHRAAGIGGRDIDLLIGLKALNGLFLWGSIIALSRAVHRVTDDVIVSGLWVGVTLALSTGLYRAILKYTPLAPVNDRAQAAYGRYKAELNAKAKARKEAKARGEKPEGPALVIPDSPADAARHVAVLVRKDLFADPPPVPKTPPVD